MVHPGRPAPNLIAEQCKNIREPELIGGTLALFCLNKSSSFSRLPVRSVEFSGIGLVNATPFLNEKPIVIAPVKAGCHRRSTVLPLLMHGEWRLAGLTVADDVFPF